MIKPKQRITTPMTVIAIFATLSETSAAISLPFLDDKDKDKDIYIWFLISFPFYLLLLFFATLNFNYRSLYAPSDFEKGKHFIKVMDKAERSGHAQDQPDKIGLQPNLSTQNPIRLPELIKDLHIVDARWMNKKMSSAPFWKSFASPRGIRHTLSCFSLLANRRHY